MTTTIRSLATLSAAALLQGCAAAPPAAAPTPAPAAAAVHAEAAAELTEARALELGRGYVALMHAGDYDQLWAHLTPAAQENFGSIEAFRSGGERALGGLGEEVVVVGERVEAARPGMMADRLYLRTSRYTADPETSVRLMIGLKHDGSIAGIQVRRAG